MLMSDDTEKTEAPGEAAPPAEQPSPEAQPPSEFQQTAQGIEQILSTMPKGGTAKMRLTYWLIGLAITVIGGTAYPVATALSSYADKRAERETSAAKQHADALVAQRQMQTDLLKRIIAVADKATLKDPTSIFQLGLIAQMVNENKDAFGIKLLDAERTMKRMFDSLAPVSGLRRRLAESNRLLGRINRKVQRAERGIARADRSITELRKKQAAAQNKWQRQHFGKAIVEQQHYRDHHDLQLQFYQLKAKREKSMQQYFQGELEMQEATLTRRLQQTTVLRNKMKDRTARFSYLLTKLRTRSKVTQSIAAQLHSLMAELESDTEKAQQDNKRLNSELSSERDALDAAKRALKRTRARLQWYRQNQRLNITVLPMPLIFWPCCPEELEKPKARKLRTRRLGAASFRRPKVKTFAVMAVRAAPPTMQPPRRVRPQPRRVRPRRTVHRRFLRRRSTLQGLFGPE